MKTLHAFYLLSSLLLLASCSDGNKKSDTAAAAIVVPAESTRGKVPTLATRWESDTTLTTVESVLYDTERKHLYTANIEDGPWEADGKGSIGILALDGTVINARWVSGLNAPKGMGIHDGKLFVADLDAVVEIDIAAKEIVKRHVIDGAAGLNDVDIAADGTIYVSDSNTGKVHQGRPGAWTTVVENMQRPNGVLVTDEGVLLGDTQAQTLSRLTSDGKRETLVEGVQPDGIIALRQGSYLISRWGGEIHYINEDWQATSLFTSPNETDKTADLGYVPEQDLVLVPTFFGNRVLGMEVR